MSKLIERDSIIQGYIDTEIERDGVLIGKGAINADAIVTGMTLNERDGVLYGTGQTSSERWFVVGGHYEKSITRDAVLSGKTSIDRYGILTGKPCTERSAVLQGQAVNAYYRTRRMMLSDNLRLRTTAVYGEAGESRALQWIYGDLSMSRVSCTQISGQVYHVADHPVMDIGQVYVANDLTYSGYRAYTSYRDDTGRSVAAIVFDSTPNGAVTCSVKGKQKATGELLETPDEIIRDIILNLQEYDSSCIDSAEFMTFHAESIRRNMKIGLVINGGTLRSCLDSMAYNIGALWLFADGRSVMRYRWQ